MSKSNEAAAPAEDPKKEKKRDYLLLRPDQIIVEENFNARMVIDADEMDSIRMFGIIQPIQIYKCRKGKIFENHLIDGERRLYAVKELHKQGIFESENEKSILEIPCFVQTETSETDRIFMMLKSNDHKALNSVETGHALARLKSLNVSEKVIAGVMGKTQPWVNNMLTLSTLPDDVQDEIISGAITYSEVLKIRKNLKDQSQLSHVIKKALMMKIEQERSLEKVFMQAELNFDDEKPIKKDEDDHRENKATVSRPAKAVTLGDAVSAAPDAFNAETKVPEVHNVENCNDCGLCKVTNGIEGICVFQKDADDHEAYYDVTEFLMQYVLPPRCPLRSKKLIFQLKS